MACIHTLQEVTCKLQVIPLQLSLPHIYLSTQQRPSIPAFSLLMHLPTISGAISKLFTQKREGGEGEKKTKDVRT